MATAVMTVMWRQLRHRSRRLQIMGRAQRDHGDAGDGAGVRARDGRGRGCGDYVEMGFVIICCMHVCLYVWSIMA